MKKWFGATWVALYCSVCWGLMALLAAISQRPALTVFNIVVAFVFWLGWRSDVMKDRANER
jgi:hypothetical protein